MSDEKVEMTEEARAARRAYYREYYRTHKQQRAEAQMRFYLKRARELKEGNSENDQ